MGIVKSWGCDNANKFYISNQIKIFYAIYKRIVNHIDIEILLLSAATGCPALIMESWQIVRAKADKSVLLRYSRIFLVIPACAGMTRKMPI